MLQFSDCSIFNITLQKQSYILPSEATIGETKVKKGSWVATIEVEDSEQYDWIWEGIKDGTFNGLSIQCDAYEQPMET